ncbi:MAG: DMT family transporter [Pseudomonadota bacterium]
MSEGTKKLAADYGLLTLLAAIFGLAFMLTKVAVAEVPPATIVFIRLLVATIFVGVVMLWAGQKLMPLLPHWKVICVAGFFGNAMPFFLISWGQERVDAGLTAILMAVMPLITLVMAHFMTNDEKLNVFKVIGFCLGLLGVAVLIGFDKLATLGDETIRQYAIMAAACCYAVHAIISKRLTGMPRIAVSTAVLLVSALMLLPFSFYLDSPWNLTISAGTWWSLILLGVVPTAIGTLLLFAIVQRQGAGFLSQINFLVPVFGVLWAIIFINEVLPSNAVWALLIILAGVAVARINLNSNKSYLEKAS